MGSEDKINLVLKLHGRVGLLRSKESRGIITDALPQREAVRLCEYLGLSSENPWDSLQKMSVRKGSRRENELFEWFEIDPAEIPQDLVAEVPPTLVEVGGQHGLFKHQRTAIRKVRSYLESSAPRAFLHMPTGSGKTRTAMNYICELLAADEPRLVVWFAFSGELCEQAAREFQKAWGYLGNREVELQRMWGPHDVQEVTHDGILIVGTQKLWSRVRQQQTWLRNLADRIDLVVFDEAHQSTAETYQLMVETILLNENCKLLGLSATPGRTYNDPDADEELSSLYYKQKVPLMVEGYDSPLDFLVDKGYLSNPTFEQMTPPSEPLSENDLDRLQGLEDYDQNMLKRLSEDEERNILILDKVKELVREGHHRILVFCVDVEHSNLLSIFMNMKSEIRCASITSDTPAEQRQYWIDTFVDSEDTEPCVLFNFGVLTTGFDAPQTSAAIIARPTKSLVLYSQMVGRVIRGKEVGGTSEAVIWTVVDKQLPGFRSLSEAFWNWEDVW